MPIESLDPDALELQIATYMGIIPPCPFCGGNAVLSCSVNEQPLFGHGPVYQARISCTNYDCWGSVLQNEHTRDAAQKAVMAQWARRTPHPKQHNDGGADE